jgi:acyl-CoA synthetase (AMP-forming)/AMP-acid ligase II
VEGGEEVVALVQLSRGSPTSDVELAQQAGQHLAAFERSSQILHVPSMPLTPTEKAIKGETRQMAQIAETR